MITDPQIAAAAAEIRAGGLVAFPTETVYGLGANALDPLAVARIFELKERPRFDPIIVHLDQADRLDQFAREVPELARTLARRFWPGPLTIVLHKTSAIPDIVTADLPSAAFRVPDHPVASRLLRAASTPIAAPSANRFGCVSPTRASHVVEQFGGQLAHVLDDGPCRVGVESTVVSFADGPPKLLRPGGLALEEIESVIGRIAPPEFESTRPSAPGQLPRHYAPATPLLLADSIADPPTGRTGLLVLQPPDQPAGWFALEVLSATGDLREAAANLFAALRRLDALRLDLILAVPVPDHGLGRAINDRLRRAARR